LAARSHQLQRPRRHGRRRARSLGHADPPDAHPGARRRRLGLPACARAGVRAWQGVVRTFRSARHGAPKGAHYLVLVLLLFASPAVAQDTHLLVIVGVGGDDDHVKAFNKYALTIMDAAKKHGLPDADVTYLGENPDQSNGRMKARATRENV